MSEPPSAPKSLKTLFSSKTLARLWQGPTVSEILPRRHNNFDLLRLLAASAVILGHSYALSPKPGYLDPVQRLIHFNYSGGLAVAAFFFLSGLLVFDSFQRTKSLPLFFAARVARIFPGLAVCLILSVFVVGPLFSTLSFHDYIRTAETLSYYRNNLLLTHLQWRLPGVFTNSPLGLNGCLWSLPVEIRLYLLLGLFGLLGFFRKPLIANILIGAILAFGLFLPKHVPYFLDHPENPPPVAAFALGCLAAVNKGRIRLSAVIFAILLTFCVLSRNSTTGSTLFYITLYYASLYIFSSPWTLRIKLPGDYSYGIYIYGFVVQQCVSSLQKAPSPWVNFCISLPVTLILASLSWHFVESPAMRLLKALPEYSLQFFKNIRAEINAPVRNFLICVAVFFVILVPAAIPIVPEAAPIVSRSDLRIVSFGPDVIQAGIDFNLQPNGQSAIWLKVSRPLGADAAILLAGHPLVSAPNGNTITAFVPRRFYTNPGKLTLAVGEPVSDGTLKCSPELDLSVVAQ